MKHKIPLKPTNSHYTDSQWQAIYDQGCNLLVSASAGSGKTTVLVERVLEKIKMGVNLDELLVVTYTEAAAKEMKLRIKVALENAITNESDEQQKQFFIRQLGLLPTAAISTLHAFCLQVVRKYYYLIDFDPVFRLLTDETEIILLKEEVWQSVRETLYGQEDPAFYQLTENFSNDRSDEGFTQLVFSMADYSRSNPEPTKWLKNVAKSYQVGDDLVTSPLYQEFIRPYLSEQLGRLVTMAKEGADLVTGIAELTKVAVVLQTEYAQFQEIFDAFLSNNLAEVVAMIDLCEFVRYPSPRNLTDELKEINQQAKELRDSAKEIVKELQEHLFMVPLAKMQEIMQLSSQRLTLLSQVVLEFQTAFSKRKQQQKLLDFNDLEHFTLAIFQSANPEDPLLQSEASRYYKQRFKEVLVDEYQDINQLQERILSYVCQTAPSTGNLFMVGDVKQSIYSFRLADPSLFLTKYQNYAIDEGGRRIILAENFRSRKEVLHFTNMLFSQLMNADLGQLDYDQSAHLIAGNDSFPVNQQCQPEILIYERNQVDEPNDEDISEDERFQIDDKTEGELRIVAQKIRTLIDEGFPIYDKKQKKNRPICFQDIVLLTPTKKNNLIILEIFKEYGIPLQVNDTQNYFQATEIRIMLALLQVIDNPLQDIPLAAVLRSPIVGLSENQMVKIRETRAFDFYTDLCTFSRVETQEKQLQAKIVQFLDQLADWREFARRNQLNQLIWKIYQDTGFLDFVGGLPAGKQGQANLHALYERATTYEEMSFKGLFQFVRFIEKMQKKDKDLAEPILTADADNTVRVMTIHASKGLEFPVVFVLDLTHRFNLRDIQQSYIMDDELGCGIKYVDTDERTSYETWPYSVIKQKKQKKMLAEEMRKLYVAVTRAEEKLFLVGSYKDEASAWKTWSAAALSTDLVIDENIRLRALSLMDWIGYSIMRHSTCQNYQTSYPTVSLSSLEAEEADFSLSFFNANQLQEMKADGVNQAQLTHEEKQKDAAQIDGKEAIFIQEAKEYLAFDYPFEAACRTTSYQSVSEIKRVFEDPDMNELLTLDLSSTPRTINRFAEQHLATPKFMTQVTSPTAAEIGTATHLIMQLLPLTAKPTAESIATLIKELEAIGSISPQIADKIAIESILNFFMTPFGEQLIKEQAHVEREKPFSMLLEANRIFKNYPADTHDTILIHGIIDGYLETADELILFDYKTDHLPVNNGDNVTIIRKKYQGQLYLYKQALEQIKGRQVTQLKLILLSAQQTIDFI